MAGAVDKVFAVARILDDLARGMVDIAQRCARMHGGAPRSVGRANQIVYALLLVAGMAHKHGARHIAAVILPGQAHIQDDRIAVL